MNDDPFKLERFVGAQSRNYVDVVYELQTGRKLTHWIWYIFPQLAGLGRSETAKYFSINSLEEARAYLKHPILGRRLVECVCLVMCIKDKSLVQILGPVDAKKFASSMELFEEAMGERNIFTLARGLK